MQVHYDEGVAIHIGPEPCVGVRKDADEASVGEGIGCSLSRRNDRWGSKNKCQNVLKNVLGNYLPTTLN